MLVQTQEQIPLTAVKPLEEGLLAYRAHCIAVTRAALRERQDARPFPLQPAGDIEGLSYGRCPTTGGWFLMQQPSPESWRRVLHDVSRFRRSPEGFHAGLAQSRADHVYAPKLEWISETLRLQRLHRPLMLEAMTEHSHFTTLLRDSGFCSEVVPIEEMDLAQGIGKARRCPEGIQAAVLLESLDRVPHPQQLLRHVAGWLQDGGLLFVTALVASGFDVAVLGLNNLYLYPPDRMNCFSLDGLLRLLKQSGFELVEVSTPGALDVQIVQAHRQRDPTLPLSTFERQLLDVHGEGQAVQTFLQQSRLSSFARIVASKRIRMMMA